MITTKQQLKDFIKTKERSNYSNREAVNMRPENDEYKLVFIQVLEDFLEEYRKDDIVAAF